MPSIASEGSIIPNGSSRERFRMPARTRVATAEGPAFENGRGMNTRSAGLQRSLNYGDLSRSALRRSGSFARPASLDGWNGWAQRFSMTSSCVMDDEAVPVGLQNRLDLALLGERRRRQPLSGGEGRPSVSWRRRLL
jgi:hypothetical protein